MVADPVGSQLMVQTLKGAGALPQGDRSTGLVGGAQSFSVFSMVPEEMTVGFAYQNPAAYYDHANLAASTAARREAYPERAVFLLVSPLAFDSCAAGLWGTLTSGGHLVIPETPEINASGKGEGYVGYLRAECEKNGIPFYSMHDILCARGLEPRELLIPYDNHLTSYGLSLVAAEESRILHELAGKKS